MANTTYPPWAPGMFFTQIETARSLARICMVFVFYNPPSKQIGIVSHCIIAGQVDIKNRRGRKREKRKGKKRPSSRPKISIHSPPSSRWNPNRGIQSCQPFSQCMAQHGYVWPGYNKYQTMKGVKGLQNLLSLCGSHPTKPFCGSVRICGDRTWSSPVLGRRDRSAWVVPWQEY